MKKNENVKILVCCHKPGIWLDNDVYMPIQCGKAVSNIDLGIQGDDTGDNISAKNPNYCELTAMYWAWKNLKDVDYVGLCHYRRFFNLCDGTWGKRHTVSATTWEKADVTLSCVEALLRGKDILLAKPEVNPCSLKEQYFRRHILEDLNALRTAVARVSPEYLTDYDHVLERSNRLSPYNMFIARREVFDDYCTWLFNLLFAVEKDIPLSGHPYQARVFGFMGERLLNVYCRYKRLRVGYRQVLFLDGDVRKESISDYWAKRIRLQLLYYLNGKR